MNSIFNFVVFSLLIFVKFVIGDLKGFDDTVLFKLNWPGRDSSELLDVPENGEYMFVTTHNKEKYKCLLPDLREKEKGSEEIYSGPNPLELLSPLFSQSSCSYRLESYWTYEVCHGRYVRQYHEERDGKKVKLQEYYLGRWDKTLHNKLDEELEAEKVAGFPNPPPTKKLDGLNLPYLQLNLTDGTICDLNGKPRQTKILYVCYNHGKHEIYTFKETSTCEYELIVLSALLCHHPKYRPQESGEHPISCMPIDDSPRKPKNLIALEAESMKLKHQRMMENEELKKLLAVFTVDKIQGEDGETRVRVELRQLDSSEAAASTLSTPVKDKMTSPVDSLDKMAAVDKILSGENCLQGGSGWWKYEFCYGKSVEQYHLEKDGSRIVVRLGTFDRAAHVEWLQRHPHKRPKPQATRTHVSHFYGAGSICDKTGQPRETEVKLKCVTGQSLSSVSLYLLEPHTCQYILGVESPVICSLLPLVDEHGLVPLDAQIVPDKSADEEIVINEIKDEL
ncbi:endoplasmic reticulum lectin 1 isoform X1 [Nilaparvata lugens]|uniref:endoplasmic reticulum lectin 1 isoform X1 n=1 Tax=Nilaparvata lugens TaxID=108931 RepID=UPI000B99BE20|nr:endoplasmic reticulum lectin 1 isoform X1 [Nilaparvata lugens]